ncbi:MAG TPA: GAF domain-containing protein [Chloroflexi bacterium]|nr:GAF domain-containing protein [Chloroflexota bacterium]
MPEAKKVSGNLEKGPPARATGAEVASELWPGMGRLLGQIIEHAAEMLDAHLGGAICLVDPESGALQAVAGTGLGANMVGRSVRSGEGVIGRVFASGKGMAVEDYPDWEGRIPWPEFEKIGSVLSVPLSCDEDVLGVLAVAREAGRPPFSSEDLRLADLFAAQASAAIENARLFDRAEKARAHFELLVDANQALIVANQPEELLQAIASPATQFAGPCNAYLFYIENDEEGRPEWAEVAAGIHAIPGRETPVGTRYYLPDLPLGRMLVENPYRIITIPDLEQPHEAVDERVTTFMRRLGARSHVTIPLIVGERMVGAVTLSWATPREFAPQEIQFYRMMAPQLAMLVENRRLLTRTRQNLQHLEILYRTSQALIQAKEPDELLRAAAAPARERKSCNAILFYVDNDETGLPEWAEIVAVIRPDGQRSAFLGSRFRVQDYALGRYLRESISNEVFTIPDVSTHRLVDEKVAGLLRPVGLRSLAFVPLLTPANRIVGMLIFGWQEPHEFDPEMKQLYRVIGAQLAVTVENQRLFEETRQAKERFHHLVLSTSDLVWEVRRIGETWTLTYCSERLYEVLGIRVEEVLGKAVDDFLPSGEGSGSERKVLNGQPFSGYEFWTQHANGQPVCFLISGIPIFDGDGNLIGYRGMAKDITAQKETEQRERLAHQIGQQLTSTLSLDDLLEMFVSEVQRTFHYYHVSIHLFDRETGHLVLTKSAGGPSEEIRKEGHSLPLSAEPSIIARAGRLLKPIVANDVQRYPHYLPHPLLPDTRSEAAFPLFRGKQLLGVFDIQCADAGRFSEAEVHALENLTAQASIAIENARLYEAERSAHARADALLEAARALTSTLSLEEVLHRILHQSAAVLSYETATVVIYEDGEDDQTPTIVLHGFEKRGARIVERAREIVRESRLLKRIRETGEAIVIPDVRQSPDWIRDSNITHVRGWMGVPLLSRSGVIGVITFDSREENAYRQEHLEFAQVLAGHAVIAVENARLYNRLEELVARRTAEIEQERERLKRIVENAGEAIMFTTPDGIIEYVNPAWERQTGYTAADSIGASAAELFELPESLWRQFWEAHKQGHAWSGEVHLRRPDGSEYDAAIVVAPVMRPDGRVSNAVTVAHDITALKEVERMRSKFVANVSHELRTPIANLKLYHTLLRTGHPEKRDSYLDTMARQISRLERLVEDLLDLSRLDRGVLAMRPTTFRINELVEDVIRSHLGLAEERDLRIELDLAPDLPLIHADRERIAQVLINLLSNAINYTGPGRVIGVRTRPAPDGEQPGVMLSVWDTGPGIPPDELPFLFNRFFRGQASRLTGAPGTGLGLSIVKEIVELHEGFVTVESTPGEGSTFTVFLPAAGQHQGAE